MAAITITSDGINLLRDSMKGASNPLIKYVALGTGSNPPTVSDHTLQAEAWRKAVTSYTNGASVGEILINCYIAPSDAIGIAATEIGFFGGANATSSPNTGVLLARGLYSHSKPAVDSIQAQLHFTLWVV